MLPLKHNCYLCTKVHMLWLSFLAVFITVVFQAHAVRETKLYENLTYVPHAAHDYCVKLQRQEYTERHTPDDI